MNKKLFYNLLLLSPLLMAFQCEEDLDPQYAFNTHKVSISSDSNYSLNDTIWIEGKVSSLVLDLNSNDSIFDIEPQADDFSVFKFIPPTEVSNCKDALDHFELIFDTGDYSFIPACENADVVARPELESNEAFYSYRIGLRTLNPGDYVISWRNATIGNEMRHAFIGEDYPIENFPDQIGFDRCGRSSWRFINESDREYYFRVE
jgi:hypothetical protein